MCRACLTTRRCKSSAQPDGGEGRAKGKGVAARRGLKEALSDSRDLMDKNRIRGQRVGTSRHEATKSRAIKRRGGKFGRCAAKAVELTSGDLRRVRRWPCSLWTPIVMTERSATIVIASQESAEGIVVCGVGKAREAPQGRKARQRLG